METSQDYKGYQIWHYPFWGNVEVWYVGRIKKQFKGLGKIKGIKLAKEYIDTL